jgi:hypothetical protein
MANDEMEMVRDLDADFLRELAEDLWLCYAEEDDWVGAQREAVLRGTPAENRVVRSSRDGIPTHVSHQCAQSSFGFLCHIVFSDSLVEQ